LSSWAVMKMIGIFLPSAARRFWRSNPLPLRWTSRTRQTGRQQA